MHIRHLVPLWAGMLFVSVCPAFANHNDTLCLPDGATAVLSTDAGIHLWASLEEASGTRFDSSTKANDLTPVNNPGNNADHQEGSFSLDLVRASQQSLQRTSANLAAGFPGNPGGANLNLTVATWVKLKSTGNHPLVVKAETTAQRSWSLWIWTFPGGQRVVDPNIFDPSGNLGGNGTDFRGNTVLAVNQWYHVAWTYTGTTGGVKNGTSRIYVNGVLDAGPFDEEMDTYRLGTNPLRVGFRPNDYSDARLDEVLVLDRVLSDAEVASLYANGVVPPTVFCGDGNACNGDETCNPLTGCQPGSPLDCDDTNVCTDDTCNPGSGCVYANNTASCDDGLFCTGTDTCGGGACQHTNDPCTGGAECANACNEVADDCFDAAGTGCTADGNVCTDDVCDGAGGCGVNNAAPCDDGLFCTGSDSCGGGTCQHAGDPCAGGTECADACNEAANDCYDTAGTGCTADGNVCTDDVCNGAGGCGVDNAAPCDDGTFCNGTDTCGGGACQHSGDPCTAGTECANACNETANDCFDAAGTGCTADGNVCTDDVCDGGGVCGVNNTASCEDGFFCTGADVCSGGICQGGPPACPGLCDEGGDACNGDCPLTKQTCRPAAKSLLQIKDAGDDSRDKLLWKWIQGQATSQVELGDPTDDADYSLCLYAGPAGGLIGELRVPAASPTWQVVSDKGYKYSSSSGSAAGVRKILLKGSTQNKSKALVKAKGANIPALSVPFPLPEPVTAQLLNVANGICWGSEYDGAEVVTNANGQFKGKD